MEFTSRFGYPTIQIQQEAMLTPIGQFLYELASGAATKLRLKSGFQLGVRIVVSPFPFDDVGTFQAVSKDAVIVFKKSTPEEVHIEDVKQVNGQWLVVVGLGPTMRQAQQQAYNRIKNDIGDRRTEDHDKLLSWGYLRET